MLARYKGVCKRCGSAYPAGAEVWYDRTTKKVLSCPACESRGKPPPPVLLTRDELRVRVDDVTGRLTPEQRAAVSGSLDGVNRWLATAGAGKTSSLVALVGTLLARGVRPHRIMVTSFTTQAADEIKARLAQAYGPVAHELTLGTFHSLVRKWLLQHARLDGSYNRVDNLLDKGGGQAPAEGEAEDVFDPARPRSPLQLGRPLLGGRKTLIPWLPGRTGLGHEEAGRGMVEDYIEAVGYLQAWLVEPGSERAKKYAAFRKMPLLPEFYSLWTESLLALSLSTYDEWLYLAGKLSQKGSIFLQQRAAQLDYVIVDEAQDNNMAQLVVASSIALEGSGKLVLVGDVAQCQPAGTKVLTPQGERNIEDLRDGALVCAWDRRGKRIEKAGRAVKVASRLFTGWLTTVEAGGLRQQTQTTPNHRWLVRWAPAARDAHVVYLMRRTLPGVGVCFRLGWCKLLNESAGLMQNHLKTRARMEKADGAWILKVSASRAEASIWESIYSTRYRIPLVMFEPRDNQHYTREALDIIWKEVGANSRVWIEQLMADHRLDINHPFYVPGGKTGRQTLFEVRAEHLLDGMMQVPVKTGPYDYEWCDARVMRTFVQDLPVYSMDVERYGSYVADGICTLNSMFGFRGALPLFLWQLEKSMPGVKVKTHYLTANFRSTAPIVELANRLIKGRAWNIAPPAGAGRADGAVPVATSILTPLYTDEGEQAASVVKAAATKLALVPSDTRARPIAILGRTHARLARVEAACIQRKVPYQVQEGRGFFGRWEVRVAIAYLLLANGRGRSAKIIKDALSAPRRKLGKVFIDALLQRSPDEDLAQSARVLARRDSRWEQSAQALASDLEAIQNGLDRNGEVICGKPSLFDQGRALLAILTKATAFGVASSERFDNVKALLEIVGDFGSLDDFEKFYRSATQPPKRHEGDADNTNKLVLSTIHACVAPETWVETPMGIGTAGDLPPRGLIGTAGGLAPYTERFQYATAPAIRITVAGGYQITVTPNHGLTSWIGGRDGGDVRVRADQLQIGSWLRLALFAAHDTAKAPLLPLPVAADVRAVQHPVPRHLTEDLAELLGCIVADGTVYRGGFRYHKSDCDVADRVAALCGVLFGKRAARTHVPGPCGGHAVAEFNSTHVAAWLLQLGGVAPRQKAVPTCILQAPLGMQARFLRGLFEDGTVNVTDGVADHVHYDTCREDLARAVQKLLLRFGIISTWKAVTSNGHARHVVYIYGDSIGRFREQIGFISARKNAQLAQASQRHWNLSVPINRTELDWVRHATNPSARQNGRLRGYLSRATAADLAQDAGEAGRFLRERLRWHYAKVVKLEVVQSASVCVEVPNGSRFIQDGFDGWNSKGLEWDEVYLVGANNGVMPHDKSASAEELEEEARIEYVGVTRARHKLHICRYRLDARDQPTYASRSWILAVEARQLAGGAVTELELDEVTRGRDRFAKQAAARAEALAAAKAEKAAKTPQDGPEEVSAQDNPPMAPRSSSRGVDGSSRPPQADGQEG